MGILKIPNFKYLKRKHIAPGSAPGTLIQTSELPKPKIERIIYGADEIVRETIDLENPDDIFSSVEGKMVWIDIQGLGDTAIIQNISTQLNLHLLVMEDIAHTHQRPKYEEHKEYVYTVLRALRVLDDNSIDNEQISFVLKDQVLVTFQERPGDVFDPVRKRLEAGKGIIRKRGTDYLFYTLVDAIIDNYFPVLEAYEETMDQLEDEVRQNPSPEISRNIHAIRRQLRRFRRSVWPLRELLTAFTRNDISFIDDGVRVFFRDCYDHSIQVAEFVESNRERASDLGDLYMSVVSEKTNQVMNLLTIIATIFIPLTFLCGVYGMNFDTEASPYNMPELKWRYAYPAFWGVLVAIFLSMIWFFRRRGWLNVKR